VLELSFGARGMRLAEALLEFVERETTRLVVAAEVARDPFAIGIRDEKVGNLAQRRDRRESPKAAGGRGLAS